MTAKKQSSGGSRLIASGKKPVMLGLQPDDKDLIDQAAERERIPTTQFIIRTAVEKAKKILKKSEK